MNLCTSAGTRAPSRVVNRFRTATRRRFLGSTTTTSTTTQEPISTTISHKVPKLLHDQSIESTIEHSKEENSNHKETTELADFALALNNIQKAPLPQATTARDQTGREVRKFQAQTPNSILNDEKPVYHTAFEQQIDKVEISSPRPFLPVSPATPAPVRATTKRFKTTKATIATTPKPHPAQIFDKLPSGVQTYTYKPITDYDYYDDGNPRISIPEHSKVLIHSSGVIECLDQGNFPHPVSCKKFISCAKMETGDVLGWEYTCPKNLSFDPIGGMCNWSAGLGCNE